MTSGTTTPNAAAAEHDELPHDLGTCWNLTRDGSVARCVLLVSGDDWEARVVVNGDPLLWKRCRNAADVFGVSEDWKSRMLADGWTTVTPALPAPVRRGSPSNGVGR